MYKKHRTNASSLFLMELIIAILFFAVSAAVCVQLFVSAHVMSRRSAALSFFTNECSSVTELCRAAGSAGAAGELLRLEGAEGLTGEGLSLYYDASFSRCRAEAAEYTLTVTLTSEGRLYRSEATASSARQELIFALPAVHNTGGGSGHE